MMERKVLLFVVCMIFMLASDAVSGRRIRIDYPFANSIRFQDSSGKLSMPEGDRLFVGCHVEPGKHPIKEVSFKNLTSGLMLPGVFMELGPAVENLYMIDPLPRFDRSKHMGVWQVTVSDESGSVKTDTTHDLNVTGRMPFLREITASGDPVAPLVKWAAPHANELPEGIEARYRVRLLTRLDNQFFRSRWTRDTHVKIPEGLISPADISSVSIRVDCLGWDKSDMLHSLPIEMQSVTIVPLMEVSAGD